MFAVTHAALCDCQRLLQDPAATPNERDAASITIQAYRRGHKIDRDVASVLHGYVQRSIEQNQWGK